MVESAPRALLTRICETCLEQTKARAIAVAVVNADGHRGTAYASDEAASQLEDAGFVLGEGPCIDALRGHGPVLVNDLAEPEFGNRWPAFTAKAERLGIGSVYAFPLQLGAVSVGTLALYGDADAQLDGFQLSATLRAADQAVLALLDAAGRQAERSRDSADSPADTHEYDGFDDAMYRSEVYQASGMLAEQLHVSVGDAILRLRAHSYATDKSVHEIACDVVTRRLRFVNENGT